MGGVDSDRVQLAAVEGGRSGAKNIKLRASVLNHVVKARSVNITTAPAKDSKEDFRYKSHADTDRNTGFQEFSFSFENFNFKQ